MEIGYACERLIVCVQGTETLVVGRNGSFYCEGGGPPVTSILIPSPAVFACLVM